MFYFFSGKKWVEVDSSYLGWRGLTIEILEIILFSLIFTFNIINIFLFTSKTLLLSACRNPFTPYPLFNMFNHHPSISKLLSWAAYYMLIVGCFTGKIFFMPFHVPIEPRRMEKSHAFAAPFKEKWKAFNLTCSSSTPFGFMPTQTIWNSLRWVWGSSPARPLNVGNKCIKPDLSSKFTLLSMFMHNGWFSTLGAASLECLLSFNRHGVDASFLL